jgi:hypothetical protein
MRSAIKGRSDSRPPKFGLKDRDLRDKVQALAELIGRKKKIAKVMTCECHLLPGPNGMFERKPFLAVPENVF